MTRRPSKRTSATYGVSGASTTCVSKSPSPARSFFTSGSVRDWCCTRSAWNPTASAWKSSCLPERSSTPSAPARSPEASRSNSARRVEETLIPRGHGEADLKLHVITAKSARAEPRNDIRYEMSKPLCQTLFLERRDAQRDGVSTSPHASISTAASRSSAAGPTASGASSSPETGAFPDALVRRHMLLVEGAIFDQRLLRLSIARLNRSGLFDPIDQRHVLIARDEAAGIADVTLRLTERKGGAWNLAGPWPLEASVRMRLPRWATYAASVSIFGSSFALLKLPRKFVPVFAIQRPYIPGQGWTDWFRHRPAARMARPDDRLRGHAVPAAACSR